VLKSVFYNVILLKRSGKNIFTKPGINTLKKSLTSVELAGFEPSLSYPERLLALAFPEGVVNLLTKVSSVIRSFRRQIRI